MVDKQDLCGQSFSSGNFTNKIIDSLRRHIFVKKETCNSGWGRDFGHLRYKNGWNSWTGEKTNSSCIIIMHNEGAEYKQRGI